MKKWFVLFLMMAVSVCYSAVTVELYDTTGITDYYHWLHRASDNYIYKPGTQTWVAPATINWADRKIVITESATIQGLYVATLPTGTASGRYVSHIFQGTGLTTDSFVAAGEMFTDGTNQINLQSVHSLLANNNVVGTISAHNTGSAVYTVSSAQYNTLLDYANCIVMVIDSNGKRGIARILTRSGTTITLNRDIGGTVGCTIIIFGYVPTGSLSTGEIG